MSDLRVLRQKSVLESILKFRLKTDFYSFLRKAFGTVNPAQELLHNWHLELLSDVLMKCAERKVTRLIVNIPPRNLKSVCVSVAFPAWLLGRAPSARVIVATHSCALSLKHAADCRRIMQSQWYNDVFPKTRLKFGENRKEKFLTNDNGYYFATSVGGTLLGEGGDVLIVDDPQTPEDLFSKKLRKKTMDWFQNTLLSRLNDKKNGLIVLVTQRLHPEDLSGFLMDKGSSWLNIVIPAIAEQDEDVEFDGKIYCRRRAGDPLHPDREDIKMLYEHKKAIGVFVFSSQYQQKPMATDGSMIQRSWLCFYDALDEGVKTQSYISIDCASGVGATNDYTAIVTIRTDGKRHWVTDIFRERIKYPELRKVLYSLVERTNPEGILIENTSNGSSLLQEMQPLYGSILFSIKPRKNKLARFNTALVAIEAGNFLLPLGKSFVQEFISELLSFPFGNHDDQIDAVSQYFLWLSERMRAKKDVKIRTI